MLYHWATGTQILTNSLTHFKYITHIKKQKDYAFYVKYVLFQLSFV